MEFDGFVSYTHADARLAEALQRGVQGFAKPWYRRRALRLFRDETTLATGAELWPPIEAALASSEWFVLLASPGSAASVWVGREVAWWLEHREASRILLVHTAGELGWDGEAGRFSVGSDAVPAALQEAFTSEPRHLDVRWIDEGSVLSTRNPRFAGAIADLAAPMRGMAKDDLYGEDIRQHRRARRLAGSAASALVVLLVVSLLATVLAVGSQHRADRSATKARAAAVRADTSARAATRAAVRADAARLAAIARVEAPTNVSRAVLLALEGQRLEDTDDTRGALLATLNQSPTIDRVETRFGTALWDFGVSPDQRHDVISRFDGRLEIWAADGTRPQFSVVRTQHSRGNIAFAPDGRHFAIGGSGDGVSEIRSIDGTVTATLAAPANGIAIIHFTPDGRRIVGSGYDGRVYQWRATDGSRIGSPIAVSSSLLGFALDPHRPVGYFGTQPAGVTALDLDTGIALWRYREKGNGRGTAGVAMDPKGTTVAVTDGDTVRFLDPATGRVGSQAVITLSVLGLISYDPTGTHIVATGEDGAINVLWVVDRDDPYVEYRLRGHSGPATQALMLDDHRLISVADEVISWDFARVGPLVTSQRGDRPILRMVALGEDVVGCGSQGVERFAYADPRADRLGYEPRMRDGYCTGVAAEAGPGVVAAIFRNTDGEHELDVWQAATGRRLLSVPTASTTYSEVALSPDGTRVALTQVVPISVNADLGYEVRDVKDGRVVGRVHAPGHGIQSVAFLDDDHIVAGDNGGAGLVSVYDATSGRKQRTIATDASGAYRLAVDRVHQALTADMLSGEVLVAPLDDLSHGRTTQAGGGGQTYGAAIAGDGVVTGNVNINLVSRATGRLVGRLGEFPTGGDISVIGSDDGTAIIANSGGDELYRVSTDPTRWRTAACRVVGRNLTRAEWRTYMGSRPYHRTCP